MIDPRELMRLAIEKARIGIQSGQSPFGCSIALGPSVLAVSHNVVWQSTDITAHAEVTALREACRCHGEILLTGAIVAATCEPCPMCMAALHWARVDTVFFGATIADARHAGFNELSLSAAEIIRQGGSPVKLVPSFHRDECLPLFDEWKKLANRPY